MKRWLPIVFFFLATCVQEEPTFSSKLPRDTFKEALKRSLLIEARGNRERLDLMQESIPIDSYYDAMYRELGISKADYLETFNQFMEHPLAFEQLFAELAADLKVDTDSLNQLIKE